MVASLAVSLREIQISVGALNLELSDLEGSPEKGGYGSKPAKKSAGAAD